jgi:hypothetical protein
MNDADFKRHLKDLVHGHHRPEEHDWGQGTRSTKAAPKTKRRTPKKSAKRK